MATPPFRTSVSAIQKSDVMLTERRFLSDGCPSGSPITKVPAGIFFNRIVLFDAGVSRKSSGAAFFIDPLFARRFSPSSPTGGIQIDPRVNAFPSLRVKLHVIMTFLQHLNNSGRISPMFGGYQGMNIPFHRMAADILPQLEIGTN